ncbi:MAG: hypothetical protein C0518_01245 [Opitutus sp.]|nr:hypothetical protein [Opitutus sp.]
MLLLIRLEFPVVLRGAAGKMRRMKPVLRCLLLVSAWALTSVLAHASDAKKYAVGDTFAAFVTKDQHDQPFAYQGGARLVVVSFEMDTGKAANGFLEKQGADFLPRRNALFLSNIHGMPGIARTFAMPKMRKYPHRILLADAENFLARYPSQANHLTALSLDEKGVITAIRFVPKKEAAAAFAGN